MSDQQQRRTVQARTADTTAEPTTMREPVTLVKGSHRWMFACEPGDEPALLRRLSELASDRNAPFDWFDAALVSHQLSKRLKPGIKRIEATNSTPRNEA